MKLQFIIVLLCFNLCCQAIPTSKEIRNTLLGIRSSKLSKSQYALTVISIVGGKELLHPAVLINVDTAVTCRINEVDSARICWKELCKEPITVTAYGKYSIWKVIGLGTKPPKFFTGDPTKALCNINYATAIVSKFQLTSGKAYTCEAYECRQCDVVICDGKVAGMLTKRETDGVIILQKITDILAVSGYRIGGTLIGAALDKEMYKSPDNVINLLEEHHNSTVGNNKTVKLSKKRVIAPVRIGVRGDELKIQKRDEIMDMYGHGLIGKIPEEKIEVPTESAVGEYQYPDLQDKGEKSDMELINSIEGRGEPEVEEGKTEESSDKEPVNVTDEYVTKEEEITTVRKGKRGRKRGGKRRKQKEREEELEEETNTATYPPARLQMPKIRRVPEEAPTVWPRNRIIRTTPSSGGGILVPSYMIISVLCSLLFCFCQILARQI